MSQRIRFPNRNEFRTVLNNRVESYFRDNNLHKRDLWQMYMKTAIILTLGIVSYSILVFHTETLLAAVFWGFLLAQSHVLVGFCVMHDGGHRGYSSKTWVNTLMGLMLDLVGGNQRLWNIKHAMLHHTYTNIDALDEDLHSGGVLRLCPQQERRPWHRFQAWYALPSYSLLSIYWILFSDFKEHLSCRVGDYRIPKPTPVENLTFWGGKILYFSYALLLPLSLHPGAHVLIAFVGVQMILGFTLSIVFQLAHTVEGVAFPEPDSETGVIEEDWTIHQIQTTVDFARDNGFVNWYVGGLNFQVEHHLYSKICHIHYPEIAEIVKATCEEYKVPYLEYPTVTEAVRSHLRFLDRMGKASPA